MLAMNHHIPTFVRNQGKKYWHNIFGNDLEGKTLCVIGTGSIGKEIGKKAKAFDMKVLGIKRHPEPVENFDIVWGNDRLHEALSQSDFIVIVTPLTPDTFHLLKAEEFRVMKNTAVIINVSRGQTVDEEALINALQNEEIAGAVLDVFNVEPLPAESPLWELENVLLTPHNSALTKNSDRKTIRFLCDNIDNFRRGQKLVNQIEKNELY
jgi:phosphoglycerate dehydrogenase-like enzyme